MTDLIRRRRRPPPAPGRRLRLPAGRARLVAVWWLPVLVTAALGTIVASSAQGKAPTPSTSEPVDARALFHEQCASCHGEDGGGTVRAPSLHGVGEAAVDFYLSTGRMPKRDVGQKPPPYRPILTPAQIAALDRYVTQLAAHGGPAIPEVNADRGDAAEGGKLFRENCAACHGWGGTGGELTDGPVPAITEATPTQLGEAVRVGPGRMPVFDANTLSPAQVDALAAYLRSIQHPEDRGGNPISHYGPFAEGAVAWLVGLMFLLGFIRWIGKRG